MTSAERSRKFWEKRRKEGFSPARLILKDDTKAELYRFAKQAGSHEAAIRQLLDLVRANS